jgi:hypothetical protein
MKNWLDHRTDVSTIAIRTRQPHNPKIAIELPPLPPKGKLFFKIAPSKIFKTINAQPTQTNPNTT